VPLVVELAPLPAALSCADAPVAPAPVVDVSAGRSWLRLHAMTDERQSVTASNECFMTMIESPPLDAW
jgi:hypothetical protein